MYEIIPVPLANLYVATDKQRRLRLSADIVEMYKLNAGLRVSLGYVAGENIIAIRRATSENDPTAANVDKRGYMSAAHFFRKSRIEPEARRYGFVAEQDGWFVFKAENA